MRPPSSLLGGPCMRLVFAGYGYEYDEPALPPHEAEQLRLQKTIIALGEVARVPLSTSQPAAYIVHRTLSKSLVG